jgi:hypothetical protein
MVSKTCLVLLLAVVCLQAAGGATAAGGTKVDGPDDGKHQSIGRCEGVSLGYTVGDAKTKSHRCCWSEENENKAGVDVGLGSKAAVKTFSDAQDVCGDAAAAPLHDLKDPEDEEKFAAAMTTFIKGCEGTDGYVFVLCCQCWCRCPFSNPHLYILAFHNTLTLTHARAHVQMHGVQVVEPGQLLRRVAQEGSAVRRAFRQRDNLLR